MGWFAVWSGQRKGFREGAKKKKGAKGATLVLPGGDLTLM
jgi:hypothetical protein